MVEKPKGSPTLEQTTAYSPARWVASLREGCEPESFNNSWQHSLLTEITAVICLLVGRLLPLKEGYWAAISSIVVMQSEIRPTIVAARDRLLGTAAGAVIGGLTSVLWGDNLLAFGLAVMVSLMACNALGLKSAGRLAGTTICLMVLVPAAGPKWQIPLDRFVEVSLGILIAVTISLLHYQWANRRALVRQRAIPDKP